MASEAFWDKIYALVGVRGPACPRQEISPQGKRVDWLTIVIPGFGTWDFQAPVSEKDEDDIIEMLKDHLKRIDFKRNGRAKKKHYC